MTSMYMSNSLALLLYTAKTDGLFQPGGKNDPNWSEKILPGSQVVLPRHVESTSDVTGSEGSRDLKYIVL